MKEYDVTIEETISQGFKVKANSPEEAEDIAIQKYKNEEFVLTNPTVIEKNILVSNDEDNIYGDWVSF